MKKQLQVISNSIYTRTPFIDRAAVASHTYSVSSLVLQFFIFSFIGWLWEVLLRMRPCVYKPRRYDRPVASYIRKRRNSNASASQAAGREP